MLLDVASANGEINVFQELNYKLYCYCHYFGLRERLIKLAR
jgi:hypothetical protein